MLAPKVVEALLGTRFQGRDFLRGPLVRQLRLTCNLRHAPTTLLLHARLHLFVP